MIRGGQRKSSKLRHKRFRKPPKIITTQAQQQASVTFWKIWFQKEDLHSIRFCPLLFVFERI